MSIIAILIIKLFISLKQVWDDRGITLPEWQFNHFPYFATPSNKISNYEKLQFQITLRDHTVSVRQECFIKKRWEIKKLLRKEFLWVEKVYFWAKDNFLCSILACQIVL